MRPRIFLATCLLLAAAFVGCRGERSSTATAAHGRRLHTQERRSMVQSTFEVDSGVTNIDRQDEYPYMVALALCPDGKTLSQIFCGATLIHPDVVLTAGHCIKPTNTGPMLRTEQICIVHGTRNTTAALRAVPGNYTVTPAKELILHPDYSQESTEEFHIANDVALIVLSKPISQPARPESYIAANTTNPGFALLPDPRQNWDIYSFGFPSLAVGWGITEKANRTDPSADPEPQRLDDLRATLQALFSPETCTTFEGAYGVKFLPSGNMCGAWFGGFEAIFKRGNEEVPSTICKGDSGGPAVVPGTLIEPFGFQGDVQIGVVSSGPPCPYNSTGLRVWPADYANVAMYVDWIHEKMKERNFKPLVVATSPVNVAFKDEYRNCEPPNCYDVNVMTGEKIDSGTVSGAARDGGVWGLLAAVVAAHLMTAI